MTHHKGIDDSEFQMWRAIFAFSVVDQVLSAEEIKLLKTYIGDVPFSKQQLEVFRQDFQSPQDVVALYEKITDLHHRERFCALARALVWCDGDPDRQEEIILRRVACLGGGEGAEMLFRSRDHGHARACYQEYERAGMAGLFKVSPSVEIRV